MYRLSPRSIADRTVTASTQLTAAGTAALFTIPADRVLFITGAGIGVQGYSGASAGTVRAQLSLDQSPNGDNANANNDLLWLTVGLPASATLSTALGDSTVLTERIFAYGGASGQALNLVAALTNANLLAAYAWFTGTLWEPAELSDVWLDESIAARIAQIVKGGQVAG